MNDTRIEKSTYFAPTATRRTARTKNAPRRIGGEKGEKTMLEVFCTLVYVACGIFAYGVAGGLECGNVELSEAIRLLLGAGGMCVGAYFVKCAVRLLEALRRQIRSTARQERWKMSRAGSYHA